MKKKYRPNLFIETNPEDIAENTDSERYQSDDREQYSQVFYRRDNQKATGRFHQQVKLDMEEAIKDIYEERNYRR